MNLSITRRAQPPHLPSLPSKKRTKKTKKEIHPPFHSGIDANNPLGCIKKNEVKTPPHGSCVLFACQKKKFACNDKAMKPSLFLPSEDHTARSTKVVIDPNNSYTQVPPPQNVDCKHSDQKWSSRIIRVCWGKNGV